MDKTYDPQKIEISCYKNWEQQGYFKPGGQGSPYCIMLPPPNVTGSLHMGHAFQHTLIDILIRYHRMNGDRTLWQCGTDHAGIATQMVVERQLEQQGINRHQLGREAFTAKVWDWKNTYGDFIGEQLRRMGTSMDWSRERFTLDDGLSEAVNKVFIQLYEEGLIYRGKRLVNWDPELQTALSDLEVIATEEAGKLWHIKYPRVDGQGHVIVATTRPETMLGDAAVAVHPDDDRYQDLIGEKVELPLTDRQIPVIADEHVDPEFGTGCVKITPAHDFNDYEVWLRHKDSGIFNELPQAGLFNIFKENAAILNPFAEPPPYNLMEGGTAVQGGTHDLSYDVRKFIDEKYHDKDRYVARKMIIEDLQNQGLLEKEEDHTLMVPRSDRSRAVVEPYLTMQWYVKTQPLADAAIKAVKQGDIKFIPPHWDKTYFEWMNNIQDWCISRQILWGHRLPVWYDILGNVYVANSEQEARNNLIKNPPEGIKKRSEDPNKRLEDFELFRSGDVLDTWFSSALWPFSTLGWPKENGNTQDMRDFYPTNVLVTGFDIIFFWVARMIMMGMKFTGKVPFKEVYIHGLVSDAQGQKMSKSKGNVLDPLDLVDGIDLEALIKKRTSNLMRPKDADRIAKVTRKEFPDGIAAYGTDALRMTFASLATQGRDINFDIGHIGGYRNFCNKLWNASRYVMMHTADQNIETDNSQLEFGLAERWIMTLLAYAITDTTKAINNYRFDLAARAVYKFTWGEYCDWYLEFSKTTLNNTDSSAAAKNGTRLTLLQVLECLMRLAHPMIPFITEAIWQRVAPLLNKTGDTVMQASYPIAAEFSTDEASMVEIQWLKEFIMGVRRIRAERDIAPSKTLSVKVKGGNRQEQQWLQADTHYIQSIANIDNITTVDEVPDDAVVATAGDVVLMVNLADLIDLTAELSKLEKELQKLIQQGDNISKKLTNKDFIKRAPQAVVDKERQRQEVNRLAIVRIQEQYDHIKKLLG